MCYVLCAGRNTRLPISRADFSRKRHQNGLLMPTTNNHRLIHLLLSIQCFRLIQHPNTSFTQMVAVPELKQYLDKQIKVELNGHRVIQGKLTGYDFFLNLTINDCLEVQKVNKSTEYIQLGQCVVRGNSVINIELI